MLVDINKVIKPGNYVLCKAEMSPKDLLEYINWLFSSEIYPVSILYLIQCMVAFACVQIVHKYL